MRGLLKVVVVVLIVYLIAGCNPARRVMKDKDQFDQVGEAWAKGHPCNNDTFFVAGGRDSVIVYSDYEPDLPAPGNHYEPDTGAGVLWHDTVWLTRTRRVTYRDTLKYYVTDTRAATALQKELTRTRDSLHISIINANRFEAASKGRRGIIWVMTFMGFLLVVIAFLVGKFFKRLSNENAALRKVPH